jgi:hypothetical protein
VLVVAHWALGRGARALRDEHLPSAPKFVDVQNSLVLLIQAASTMCTVVCYQPETMVQPHWSVLSATSSRTQCFTCIRSSSSTATFFTMTQHGKSWVPSLAHGWAQLHATPPALLVHHHHCTLIWQLCHALAATSTAAAHTANTSAEISAPLMLYVLLPLVVLQLPATKYRR